MNELRSWFRVHDVDPQGCFPIEPKQAAFWNDQGYGIFWTVNEFEGGRRKENLRRVLSWAVDIDQGSKEEQWERIKRGPEPSLIIGTKRGFHVYFYAKDGSRDTWESIVSDRLIPFYQADEKARDLCRILRVPGFYHCKNLHSQYLIEQISESGVLYSEKDMFSSFPAKPLHPPREILRGADTRRQPLHPRNAFRQRVWEMDCEVALERLSGSPEVGYEVYTFRTVSNGNLNLYVNGKSTSCWIDQNKRIGSLSRGGPTIYEWLRWYGHPHERVLEILDRYFPELRVAS